jgi:hypothetical protein
MLNTYFSVPLLGESCLDRREIGRALAAVDSGLFVHDVKIRKIIME